MKKGIIYGGGEYPLGSSALRLRMWHNGLFANNIDTKILITIPAPSEEDLKNSEEFIYFALPAKHASIKIEKKSKRNFKTIIDLLKSLLVSYKFLLKYKNEIEFVFFYSSGFLDGLIVKRFCRKYRKFFIIESCDENRRKFKDKKFIFDYLAIWQENLFEKYIVPQADLLLVVSEYLENKFRKKYPFLKIKRSVPSFINYDEYLQFQTNDIFNLSGKNVSILKTNKIKICYAGSHVFTNGIKFFMKCASALITEGFDFEIIFVLYKGNTQELLNYAKELKIEQRLHIIEDIYYQYILAIYKHSDVLVLPEMGTVVANAGFPAKTSEYLAAGKAIIATDFSNIKDVLKHEYNVMMSPLGDHQFYTENLKKIITDKHLRERLGKNAIQTAIETFDYKKGVLPMVEEIIN